MGFFLSSRVCAFSIHVLKFHLEVCGLETHLKINKSRVQEPRALIRRGNSTGLMITRGDLTALRLK